MNRFLILLASAVLCLGLTACSQSQITPLDPAGAGGEYCAPANKSQTYSFGLGYPVNRAGFPVRVTRVELLNAQDATVIGTRTIFTPLEGESTAMGALTGWPANDFGDPEFKAAFFASKSIEETVIPPSETTQPTFAVGVKAGPGASGGPLRVTYTHGDNEWTWTGSITLRIAEGETCPGEAPQALRAKP